MDLRRRKSIDVPNERVKEIQKGVFSNNFYGDTSRMDFIVTMRGVGNRTKLKKYNNSGQPKSYKKINKKQKRMTS